MGNCSSRFGLISGALTVFLVYGCAGPRATGDRARGDEPPLVEIVLPGQNRTLPSKDPRNAPSLRGGRIGTVSEETVPQARPPASALSDEGSVGGEAFFQVQVLATRDREKAARLGERLADQLGIAVFVEPQLGFWKVRVGRKPDRAGAEALRHRLAGLGYDDAFVVVGEGR